MFEKIQELVKGKQIIGEEMWSTLCKLLGLLESNCPIAQRFFIIVSNLFVGNMLGKLDVELSEICRNLDPHHYLMLWKCNRIVVIVHCDYYSVNTHNGEIIMHFLHFLYI